MFCPKCGAQNEDDAKFCVSCGARLDNSPVGAAVDDVSVDTGGAGALDQAKRYRMVGIIAVAVVVVVVAIIGFLIFGGRSDTATIRRYVEAGMDGDVDAIVDLMHPDVIDYAIEDGGYDRDDWDSMVDDLDDTLQDAIDTLDSYLGDDWSYSYEIVDTHNIRGNELEDIQDAYDDADVRVTAAETAEVEVTVTGDETEQTNTQEVPLVRIGRNWYLDVMSMGGL